jgi:hypothetical protein
MARHFDSKGRPAKFSEEDYAPAFGGENFAGMGGPVNWLRPGEPTRLAGLGPRNYRRADESILDEVVIELTHHPRIDATAIEVRVEDGEVILAGTVESREMKRLAEDAADSVSGVRNVYSRIRVKSSEDDRAA